MLCYWQWKTHTTCKCQLLGCWHDSPCMLCHESLVTTSCMQERNASTGSSKLSVLLVARTNASWSTCLGYRLGPKFDTRAPALYCPVRVSFIVSQSEDLSYRNLTSAGTLRDSDMAKETLSLPWSILSDVNVDGKPASIVLRKTVLEASVRPVISSFPLANHWHVLG